MQITHPAQTIDIRTALVFTMVLTAAADQDMNDDEIRAISEIVTFLPVFRGYDTALINPTSRSCVDLLAREDGLDRAVDMIAAALPERLAETAYAIACDIAAADGELTQEELRFLEMLRHKLNVDRLHAAAIERGTRARFAHL